MSELRRPTCRTRSLRTLMAWPGSRVACESQVLALAQWLMVFLLLIVVLRALGAEAAL